MPCIMNAVVGRLICRLHATLGNDCCWLRPIAKCNALHVKKLSLQSYNCCVAVPACMWKLPCMAFVQLSIPVKLPYIWGKPVTGHIHVNV